MKIAKKPLNITVEFQDAALSALGHDVSAYKSALENNLALAIEDQGNLDVSATVTLGYDGQDLHIKLENGTGFNYHKPVGKTSEEFGLRTGKVPRHLLVFSDGDLKESPALKKAEKSFIAALEK